MSGTAFRRAWLETLRCVGIKSFISTAGQRSPFVCHVGDSLGQLPFYNLTYFRQEIAIIRAWCAGIDRVAIYDIGAHVGFTATQITQALLKNNPRVIACEPVPTTFTKLQTTIRSLGLETNVSALPSAVSEHCGLVEIAYNEWDSMLAQIVGSREQSSRGELAICPSVTIDQLVAASAVPALIKVDVEGYEASVFRGGRSLFSSERAPAVIFELNPSRLRQVGFDNQQVGDSLPNYRFYYLGSWRSDSVPNLREPLKDLSCLEEDCDIFGLPDSRLANERWQLFLETLPPLAGRSGNA